MFQLRSVNKKIKELGLPVELVKGDGYFYFIYDDVPNKIYDSKSIMVYSLTDFSRDRWVEEAKEFAAEIKANTQPYK